MYSSLWLILKFIIIYNNSSLQVIIETVDWHFQLLHAMDLYSMDAVVKVVTKNWFWGGGFKTAYNYRKDLDPQNLPTGTALTMVKILKVIIIIISVWTIQKVNCEKKWMFWQLNYVLLFFALKYLVILVLFIIFDFGCSKFIKKLIYWTVEFNIN